MKGKNKIKIRDASMDLQPKIQSSSVEETLQRIFGADQQRLQISDLHFDKFPTPATFACWKIRFKTEVCTCAMRLNIVDWSYFKIHILQEILKTQNQHQAEFCAFLEVEHLYWLKQFWAQAILSQEAYGILLLLLLLHSNRIDCCLSLSCV